MDNFANMPAYLMILRSPTRLYPRTRCPVARHFGWKLTKSRISSRIWRSWCSSRPRRGPIRGERYESLLVGNYLSNRSRPLHVRPDGFVIGIESEAEMEGPTTRPPDET